jgi:Transcriptional regulator
MSKVRRVLRTDGEATYNRIMEAAGELFGTDGFAETTNKAIASRAGVDLASINYHFKSRSGLYEAVLIEAHRRLVSFESLQSVMASRLSARDKLWQVIENLVTGATPDQGWHMRVLAREILSPSSHIQVLMDSVVLTKMPMLLAILSEITSIPLGDPALIRLLSNVMAPCVMLMVIGRNISFYKEEVRNMSHQDLVNHFYTFAIGGLDAIAEQYRLKAKALSQ